MSFTLGQPVTEFTAEATNNTTVTLSELKGRKVVIYFYPKDNTPGCISEGQTFRDLYSEFQEAGTLIFGVSRDSLKSHENFKAKHEFPFELISDPDEELCKLFDVIKLKNMYGKEYMGIERSTFLIDREGILQHEWRKVRIKKSCRRRSAGCPGTGLILTSSHCYRGRRKTSEAVEFLQRDGYAQPQECSLLRLKIAGVQLRNLHKSIFLFANLLWLSDCWTVCSNKLG